MTFRLWRCLLVRSCLIVTLITCHDLGKLVCFSQKPIENKEDKSLHKMHFKPIGSSAVEELHKLTD